VKNVAGVALLCLALTGLAGCGDDLFTSGDKGFVSGNGEVTILPATERTKPDPISGTTITGDRVGLDDFAGKIVVMPVWGSWCGPCRAEAPMLQAASVDLAKQGVAFLGINVRDDNEGKRDAFVRNTGMTYPSFDNLDGSLMLNFRAGLSPKTIPSVVFIDPEGRVAAAVRGEITRSTLYDVIQDIQQ
jgi:thiol-disulfide isomerase/thioredoxin